MRTDAIISKANSWHLFIETNLKPFAYLHFTLLVTSSSQRFIQRLEKMEDVIDRPLSEYSLEELDALWQQAKAQLGHYQ